MTRALSTPIFRTTRQLIYATLLLFFFSPASYSQNMISKTIDKKINKLVQEKLAPGVSVTYITRGDSSLTTVIHDVNEVKNIIVEFNAAPLSVARRSLNSIWSGETVTFFKKACPVFWGILSKG